MRPSFLMAFALVAAVAGGPALADPASQAIDAARAGDFVTALGILVPEAQRGDAHAEFVLGLLYESGAGVAKDAERAAGLYRQSADQGLPTAQNNLGSLYANGEGVAQDTAQAVHWWQMAADGGLSIAQVNLADFYANVQEDLVQSYKWATLAAAQGEEDANGILAQIAPAMTPEQVKQGQLLVQVWGTAPTHGA